MRQNSKEDPIFGPRGLLTRYWQSEPPAPPPDLETTQAIVGGPLTPILFGRVVFAEGSKVSVNLTPEPARSLIMLGIQECKGVVENPYVSHEDYRQHEIWLAQLILALTQI